MVLTAEEKISKKTGDPMAFLQVDDGTGQLECSVFSKHYHKWEQVRDFGEPLLITGKLNVEYNPETEESRFRLLADGIQRLDEARRQLTRAVAIRLDAGVAPADAIDQLYRIARKYPGPTPLEITMVVPGIGQMKIRANSRWAVDPTEDLLSAIRAVLESNRCGFGEVPVEIL